MTQEQADQMLKRVAEGGGAFSLPGAGSASQNGSILRPGIGGRNSGTAASLSQLKQGLSVTVNVVTAQRLDVLVVPNEAVSTRAGAMTVSVTVDGKTEERSVTCGISDFQYTEVLSGLDEGEQVIFSRAASTGTSGSPNRNTQRGGQFFIPGSGIRP
jgi:multidrug efflux pump subunit AcrA (membrane-fusion protein)